MSKFKGRGGVSKLQVLKRSSAGTCWAFPLGAAEAEGSPSAFAPRVRFAFWITRCLANISSLYGMEIPFSSSWTYFSLFGNDHPMIVVLVQDSHIFSIDSWEQFFHFGMMLSNLYGFFYSTLHFTFVWNFPTIFLFEILRRCMFAISRSGRIKNAMSTSLVEWGVPASSVSGARSALAWSPRRGRVSPETSSVRLRYRAFVWYSTI